MTQGADLSARATIPTPKGGTATQGNDVVLEDVTPLGHVLNYPNDYQPGTGSGAKAGTEKEPHGNVIELLRQHGAPE